MRAIRARYAMLAVIYAYAASTAPRERYGALAQQRACLF